MSKLEQNTTALDEVLAMVNALPDAGSGGGGVETCTVTLASGGMAARMYFTSVDSNGGIMGVFERTPYLSDATVVCGTYVTVLYVSPTATVNYTCTGAELSHQDTYGAVFKINESVVDVMINGTPNMEE